MKIKVSNDSISSILKLIEYFEARGYRFSGFKRYVDETYLVFEQV